MKKNKTTYYYFSDVGISDSILIVKKNSRLYELTQHGDLNKLNEEYSKDLSLLVRTNLIDYAKADALGSFYEDGVLSALLQKEKDIFYKEVLDE